jgi:alkylation response protein AidB-like acyl-CoA dehydrogenase
MESLILSRRDLDFLLYEWLQAEKLSAYPRYAEHSRETFDAVVDLCQRMATDLFAPHNKKGDQNEPHFDGEKVTLIPEVKTALDALAGAGLFAAAQDYQFGGMQLPVLIEKAAYAWFMGANIATSGYPFLTIGNANTLLKHGTYAQIKAFAMPELEGRYFGTMCLSEPQAGSSLSDIASRAEYEGESEFGPQYRITGNKMWISGGEHDLSENIVHLVLAKVPDENGRFIPGVKGISLFVVPKFLVSESGELGERNDVMLAGLNHKMGYRGTVNTLLNFGEGSRHRPGGRAGAVGYLVGPLHQGLPCMFHMMNEARIGVGMGATLLGYTGYLHALDYARNRPQGRPLTAAGKDASSPQTRIIDHADVKRMLLAQKSYVEGALALNLYCARLVDEERNAQDDEKRVRATLLLEILTPIAKSWPSQWCLEANNLAIQVHGGYGYTRDYNVEQFYRDNRLNPIHEGTHGIQGMDLLGRKVVMHDGAALRLLAETIQQTLKRAAAISALSDFVEPLASVMQKVGAVTGKLWGTNDPQKALANASVYLEAFGHMVLAWIWLEQALLACKAVEGSDADFYRGKMAACRYFFEWELPRTRAQLDLLSSLNTLTLDMQDRWF